MKDRGDIVQFVNDWLDDMLANPNKVPSSLVITCDTYYGATQVLPARAGFSIHVKEKVDHVILEDTP